MLSKAQKTRVRGRIYRRFYRLGKRLGKSFREIEINGKDFESALRFELAKEEDLAKKGTESELRRSRHFDPEKIKGFTPRNRKRKSNMDFLINPSDAMESHKETCTCNKCMGAFGDPDLIDSSMLGESDERKEARLEFTKEINRQLEEQTNRNICPRCRSSVCHCGDACMP